MRNATVAFIYTMMLLLVSGCGGGGSANVTAGAVASPFSVSGKVTLNGVGLGQVAISISGAGQEFSDGNGHYGFNNLPNGSYTVTPSRHGYSFTPASQTVTIGNNGAVADFTAAAVPSFTVSGKVSSSNGAGLAGATVRVTDAATGAVSGSQVTDGSGSYAISGLNSGDYLVTVSHSDGYSFTPASRSLTVSNSDVTAQFAANVATFALSGRVASAGGSGLGNVSMVLLLPGSGASYSTVTDSLGNYTLAGIPDGYYTLTPALAGYAFVPNPYLVHVNGADSTGNSITAAPAASGTGSVNIDLG